MDRSYSGRGHPSPGPRLAELLSSLLLFASQEGVAASLAYIQPPLLMSQHLILVTNFWK